MWCLWCNWFYIWRCKLSVQNCNIYIRCFLGGSVKTVTAEGREKARENGGVIIHNRTITTEGNVKTIIEDFSQSKHQSRHTWDDRGEIIYSRTIISQTFLDEIIDPKVWLVARTERGDFYYDEYSNKGPVVEPVGKDIE